MMLEEEGLVEEVSGDKALVRMERKGACANCQARRACHVMETGTEVQARVLNPLGATVGDRVKITMPSGVVLKSSFILYFLPATGLIAGSCLGYYLGKSYGWNLDLSALLSGLLVLGMAFLIAFFMNQRLKGAGTHWPQIEKIIRESNPDANKKESLSEPRNPGLAHLFETPDRASDE